MNYLKILEISLDIDFHFRNYSLSYSNNEYWKKKFFSYDVEDYEKLLFEFKDDRARKSIISHMLKAYESLDDSIKRDYRIIYNFLNNYFATFEILPSEKFQKQFWAKTKHKKQFIIMLCEKMELEETPIDNQSEFVRKIFHEYKFEGGWTIEKCMSSFEKYKHIYLGKKSTK